MVFPNGNRFCTRCGYKRIEKEQGVANETNYNFVDNLPAYAGRGIRADISEVYGVRHDPELKRIYIPSTTDLVTTGYTVKEGSHYEAVGNTRGSDLFGQHLLRTGGNRVFITEGQLDCLSVAQALVDGANPEKLKTFGFPCVVSLQHGVSSAKATLGRNRKLLEAFKEVILVPDQDEAGKALLEAAYEVLDPSKLRVVNLPTKDANELLQKGGSDQIRMLVLSAKPYQPEALIWGEDITYESLTTAIQPGYTLPQFPGITAKLRGIRAGVNSGELTVICSGSGMGKTTYTHEWAWSFRRHHDLTIGQIRLEETVIKSAQALIAIDNNLPLALIRSTPEVLSREQWEKSRSDLLGIHKVGFLDHFGSLDSKHLIDHFKFLAYSAGCRFIFLDHISMVVSGQTSSQGERKDIDNLMTNLAGFVEKSGTSVVAVVHLKRPDGDNSYNQGFPIGLSSLRGSGGLEQLSHNVIAIEGNQANEERKNIRYSKVLKSREWGDLGHADTMVYNPSTGRLLG